jgi:hypothetical protein
MKSRATRCLRVCLPPCIYVQLSMMILHSTCEALGPKLSARFPEIKYLLGLALADLSSPALVKVRASECGSTALEQFEHFY